MAWVNFALPNFGHVQYGTSLSKLIKTMVLEQNQSGTANKGPYGLIQAGKESSVCVQMRSDGLALAINETKTGQGSHGFKSTDFFFSFCQFGHL
jgi:hypothetical protein